ncbi:MAG TPA: tetratricopeptide repeat protein [Chthoniobacterales bacterium]|nr:tetratricopeptide repeat protein [Chthoniobacterales bacterium]
MDFQLLREKVPRGIKTTLAPLSVSAASTIIHMPTAPPPSRDAALETRFFWETHKTEIVAVLLLVLLAIVGYGAYRFYSDRRDAAAAALLARAKTTRDFEQVVSAYPNTPAGANAYLLLADAQRNERKFAESNATLQAFIAKYPKHELVTSAWMAIAANYESLGKMDEALATYEKAAASDPDNFNTPLALLSQVHLLKAKNKTEEARIVCEKILTNYRESVWANEAMRQLRLLKPPTPAAAASSPTGPAQPAPPPLLARPAAPPVPSAAPQPKKP